MSFLQGFDLLISVVFLICYSYQFYYILIALFKKDKPAKPAILHRYRVLICARNEEGVIGQLISSIKAQDYPESLVEVFVMADNCTDNTRIEAAKAGATVYTRRNSHRVGKGYAMDALLKCIVSDYTDSAFDGYFVFDADNILSPGYISRMNSTFSQGYDIVTSYRNSKNYGENWISAGYRLWFLREAEYLHHARNLCGVSRGVSGTGFMFSARIMKENGGWPFHLLTEDIEFTASSIIKGEKIGYCKDAEFYDEQPVTFRQSVTQRLRWRKGYFQVFSGYGADLAKQAFIHRNFSCYDMIMNLLPAAVLTLMGIGVNIAACLAGLFTGGDMAAVGVGILSMLAKTYGMLFFIGAVTTITQWKKIRTTPAKKIGYTFTFPLFMLTWIPITFSAFFCDVSWQPITHTASNNLKDIIGAR